jgi:DNA-binding PadR family transcriptional regulator
MLKLVSPKCLTYKDLSRNLLKYNDRMQIHNSLREMERRHYIVSEGPLKNKLYRITPSGLKYLYIMNVKASLKQLENYFLTNPTGLD